MATEGALISPDIRFCWFLLVCQGVSGETFLFYFLCVLSLDVWGSVWGNGALISPDIRFYWFLLQGEVPDTTQRKDKVQSTSRDLCVAPLAEKPTDKFRKQKKKKKKPREILRRGEERSTHQIPT